MSSSKCNCNTLSPPIPFLFSLSLALSKPPESQLSVAIAVAKHHQRHPAYDALQTASSPSPHRSCTSFILSTDLQIPEHVQSKDAMHVVPACAFHSQSGGRRGTVHKKGQHHHQISESLPILHVLLLDFPLMGMNTFHSSHEGKNVVFLTRSIKNCGWTSSELPTESSEMKVVGLLSIPQFEILNHCVILS